MEQARRREAEEGEDRQSGLDVSRKLKLPRPTFRQRYPTLCDTIRRMFIFFILYVIKAVRQNLNRAEGVDIASDADRAACIGIAIA
jgi:hypothetical protein